LFFPKWYGMVRSVLRRGMFLQGDGNAVKRSQAPGKSGLSRRLHFPQDEKRLPWLPMLLDAYAIADTGINIAIRDEEKHRTVRLACRKGCGSCCVHQRDIPLYPHELVGIYWYVTEKLSPAVRDVLKRHLASHTPASPCPFLIEGSCSIHPLRPLGCRQFNVFTMPCEQGEDPYHTRREDVLTPIQDYTDRAFAAVLPFYDLKKESDAGKAVRLIRSQIMNLQTFNWNRLVAIIENPEGSKVE
jgi:Fe-S-cluster containining protein